MARRSKKLIAALFFAAVIINLSETHTNSETQLRPAGDDTFLQIGLIPERNIFRQIERYKPIAGYLAEKTATKIKLKMLTRYGNIVDNFIAMGLDGAFFGSFTYTLANAKLDIIPVARPENSLGISTYHGLIFVRKDSGIKSIKDMQDKIFAFVDKATTAGFILPLAYFKENGIKDYKTFFKETYFAGTHEDAVYDVLNKKADIGAAKNTIFNSLAAQDSRITKELLILKRSPDVPENALAVRKKLDNALTAKIKKVLLEMDKNPIGIKLLKDFGARRFIETTRDDYSSVNQYVHQIGIDLNTYNYLND